MARDLPGVRPLRDRRRGRRRLLDRLPPRAAGLGATSCCVDRAQLTSGSTFHSAGLVGQLRGSVSLTRMMMDSVELYRTLDCGWVECGGLRLACSPERWEETRRQAGWAKTFGLPLELISRRGGARALPADDHRRRARRVVAADRRLPRPEPAHLRARRGRARGRLRHPHQHARDRDRRARRARARACRPTAGDIEAEVVVNAGGMFAAEIGRLAGVRVPLVPMAHEYLVTQPFRERDPDEPPPDHARPRPPHLLPRGRRRARDGRLRAPPGAVGARRGRRRRHPRRLQRPPARGGLGALRGDHRQRPQARAGDGRGHDHAADQRARGVHARRRVPASASPHVRGFFVAAGFCAHGLAGAGGMGKADGRVDRRGRAVARRLGRWTSRRFGEHYRSPAYTLKRTREVYETYYDIKYPGHERQAGRPLRVSPGLRLAPRRTAPRSARSPAGSGSTGTRRTRRRATRRCARAAGPGSTGRPPSAPSTPPRREAAALFDETSFAKLEVSGPGAAALLERLCDNRVVREAGQGHLHADAQPPRRDRVRLHGHAARRGPLLDRHRHRVRHPRPRLDRARTPATTCWSRTSPRAGPASGCGARGRATSSPPCTPDPLDFGVHELRGRSRSATCRCARCASPTSASWAGSSTARWSSARALWRTLWEAGEPHGLVAGGYRAIDSLRLEKGYRVWGADITPDDTPVRGRRSASRSSSTTTSSAATRWTAPPSPRGGCAASCSPTRARSRSATSRCAPAARSAGASPAAATATRSAPRSPTPTCPPSTPQPGTEVAVEVFGEWIDGEVRAEPLFDPEGARVRG